MNQNRANSIITLSGVIGFIVVVIYLHILQIGYSPINQLMSELALGQKGYFMLYAFISFSVALLGALKILSSFNAHLAIKSFLGIASIAMLGAGIFTLGNAATLHISLVALAFILVVLSMYLIPRLTNAFQSPLSITICWGLGASTAIFVALGHNIIPIGLAQRLAVSCILLWLSWLAIFNSTQQGGHGA